MKSLRTLFYVLLLSILPAFLQAQSIVVQARIADEGPLETSYLASCRDSAGNHYITGVTGGQGESGPNSGEVITQKVSSAGTVLWTGTFAYPPESMCYPRQITVDASGEVYIAGTSTDVITNLSSLFALKISSTGANLWSAHFSGYTGLAGIAADSTGNMYVATTTTSTVTFLKLNAATGVVGYTQSRTYGTQTTCSAFAGSTNGRFFALLQSAGKPSILVAYTEATGAAIWTQAAANRGSFTDEIWSSFVVLSSGNVVVAGTAADSEPTSGVATLDWLSGATGAFVYREAVGAIVTKYGTKFSTPLATDSSNDVFWLATTTDIATNTVSQYIGKYGPTAVLDWYRAIAGTAANQLLAAADDGGMFVSYISASKRWFNRVSSAGAVLWSVAPTTSLSQTQGQLIPDSSDDLAYIAGYTDTFGNDYFGLLSLNAAAGAVQVNGYETPSGDRSNAINVADQDPSGNAYVSGTESRGWYVAKLSPAGAVIWRKTIPPSVATTPPFPGSICYSNGEVAVAASGGPSPEKQIVVKLDATTGDVIWNTTLTVPYSSVDPQTIKIDPSGNVDVGLNDFVSNYGVAQFKGTTGVLNWQQWETADTPNGAIAVDANGNIYLSSSFWYTMSPSTALIKISEAGKTVFSTIEYYGSSPTETSIQCDPASGDLFMESSDTVMVGGNTVGAIDVARYDTSGNQLWFNAIQTTGYASAANVAGKLRSANGLLYLIANVSATVGAATNYAVECVNASTGKAVWQNVIAVANNGGSGLQTPWALDQYGDVIFTAPMPGASRALDRFQTIKLDALTGATRFQTTYNGTFASTFNSPSAVTVGTDDEPLILGETAFPYGPGSEDSFVIKYADAHAPICVNDAYTCAENTALPSTDPSVFANDRDISGATCHLVSGPSHSKTFSLSTSGVITYTPVANFKGTDTFTYDAVNAYGTSNVATVTITVQ